MCSKRTCFTAPSFVHPISFLLMWSRCDFPSLSWMEFKNGLQLRTPSMQLKSYSERRFVRHMPPLMTRSRQPDKHRHMHGAKHPSTEDLWLVYLSACFFSTQPKIQRIVSIFLVGSDHTILAVMHLACPPTTLEIRHDDDAEGIMSRKPESIEFWLFRKLAEECTW